MTTKIPIDDRRPGLPPPRFRLATLMWIIAFVCAVLAMMKTVGPYGAFALTLFVFAIFAHVAGNAIGTHLRSNGNRAVYQDGTPVPRSSVPRRPLTEEDYAPTTRLGQRYSLGLTVIISTILGLVLGAGVGGTFLVSLNWQRITLLGVVFAVVFTGFLGGFAGFLMSSLMSVLLRAQVDAWRGPKRP